MNIAAINKKIIARAPIILGVALMLLSGGCKPSEKNYRSAYTAALEKRERDEAQRRQLQDDLGVDRTALQSADDNGAMWITLTDPASDDTLRVMSKHASFHREDGVKGAVAAVATMRMASNANALADDLKSEGFGKARVVRSGENYIVIIDEGSSATDLAHEVMRFRKAFPEFTYMGQSGPEVLYRR